jgi:hypothetical protein
VTVYSLAERFGVSRVVAAGTCISVFALLLSLNSYSIRADKSSGFAGRPRAIDPRGEKWRGIEAQRYTHYRAVAEFLNGRDHHSRHHSVLTSEVGVFGYYYAGRVIDAVGLNSPEVLKFYPPSHAEIYNEQGRFRTSGQNFTPIALVMALEPDYLVNSLAFSANLLRSDSPFRKAYSVIKRFPRVWGMPIVVFERSRNP